MMVNVALLLVCFAVVGFACIALTWAEELCHQLKEASPNEVRIRGLSRVGEGFMLLLQLHNVDYVYEVPGENFNAHHHVLLLDGHPRVMEDRWPYLVSDSLFKQFAKPDGEVVIMMDNIVPDQWLVWRGNDLHCYTYNPARNVSRHFKCLTKQMQHLSPMFIFPLTLISVATLPVSWILWQSFPLYGSLGNYSQHVLEVSLPKGTRMSNLSLHDQFDQFGPNLLVCILNTTSPPMVYLSELESCDPNGLMTDELHNVTSGFLDTVSNHLYLFSSQGKLTTLGYQWDNPNPFIPVEYSSKALRDFILCPGDPLPWDMPFLTRDPLFIHGNTSYIFQIVKIKIALLLFLLVMTMFAICLSTLSLYLLCQMRNQHPPTASSSALVNSGNRSSEQELKKGSSGKIEDRPKSHNMSRSVRHGLYRYVRTKPPMSEKSLFDIKSDKNISPTRQTLNNKTLSNFSNAHSSNKASVSSPSHSPSSSPRKPSSKPNSSIPLSHSQKSHSPSITRRSAIEEKQSQSKSSKKSKIDSSKKSKSSK